MVEACAVITDGTAQEMGFAGPAAWPPGGRCTSLPQQTGISFQKVFAGAGRGMPSPVLD